MSSLVTNPTSQFINPHFGTVCENAKIFIGLPGTDSMVPENRQEVYLLNLSDESAPQRTPLPQPLLTNSAGVIVYQGVPVTPWVDNAHSITIVGYSGAVLYQSFYVDDPTYWLRLDLNTEPQRTPDGLHYVPEDEHGVHMVAGAAPILSPDFQGEPRALTPPANDKSTRLATTAYVADIVNKMGNSGVVGELSYWSGTVPPANAVVRDGSALSREAYPELYAILGDQVALANGLTTDSASFYVPDSRSRYDRGSDNGAARSGYAQPMKYYEDMFEIHDHSFSVGGWRADGNSSGNEGLFGNGSNIPLETASTGGAETMPMTVPSLPIIWVSSGIELSAKSQWWLEQHHLLSRPAIHHYHERTGEYQSSTVANPSPREPGVWLIPAHATDQVPAESKPGHVVVFREGAWAHDAELFQQREAERKKETESRERQNREIMEREQRRQQINDWMKAQGAPFTLDDI